jgi:DNA-directed RNA polymerase subunit K/omega
MDDEIDFDVQEDIIDDIISDDDIEDLIEDLEEDDKSTKDEDESDDNISEISDIDENFPVPTPLKTKIIKYPMLSKYELTKIIGLRATQISEGADIYINIPKNMIDPIQIAELELQQNKIPYLLHREINSTKPNESIEVIYKIETLNI